MTTSQEFSEKALKQLRFWESKATSNFVRVSRRGPISDVWNINISLSLRPPRSSAPPLWSDVRAAAERRLIETFRKDATDSEALPDYEDQEESQITKLRLQSDSCIDATVLVTGFSYERVFIHCSSISGSTALCIPRRLGSRLRILLSSKMGDVHVYLPKDFRGRLICCMRDDIDHRRCMSSGILRTLNTYQATREGVTRSFLGGCQKVGEGDELDAWAVNGKVYVQYYDEEHGSQSSPFGNASNGHGVQRTGIVGLPESVDDKQPQTSIKPSRQLPPIPGVTFHSDHPTPLNHTRILVDSSAARESETVVLNAPPDTALSTAHQLHAMVSGIREKIYRGIPVTILPGGLETLCALSIANLNNVEQQSSTIASMTTISSTILRFHEDIQPHLDGINALTESSHSHSHSHSSVDWAGPSLSSSQSSQKIWSPA
ncbi:uncharacterized protein EI90DRAFT_3016213 [Cantharellus anzutake]|uniref:uncharacterized protein n=1 Tax=Cantharellus anzutake TaxID=1750568 RepID=UPI00190720CE|nr:uncharacterized protein EI90DRAFT_3016213 [Cantharellus anzutake]KAF8331627.1 hypothetical protein EI90DRAFT_3016213 [Cantharellus anzutake]